MDMYNNKKLKPWELKLLYTQLRKLILVSYYKNNVFFFYNCLIKV
jgi:hypothetical protein